ncbi:MAG TPA: hypothetical protein VFE28_12315 [Candidatus Krumholzibacteria bacterium]|nr:hypothetical protein [Candidatus Krumholzibacteria bacterium]
MTQARRLQRFLVVTLLLGGAAMAAEVEVRTSPDSVTVGDSVTVELRLLAPPGAQVAFPRPQTPSRVEVLKMETPPPEAGTWRALYTLAVYDVGDVVLPPWPVQVKADTHLAIVHTDSIRLHVASVLDDSLAAADIRDLKGQQDVPVPLPLWVWIVTGALVLAAALVFFWWRRRRRRPVAAVAAAPPVAPHTEALAELRQLEAMQLPAAGKIKEHYIRLSEILRRYLEKAPQFGFAALEETTDEILRELRARRYKAEWIQALAAMCHEADLVKFAKLEPTIVECDAALERVRRFVSRTAQVSALELRTSQTLEAVA